MERYKRLLLIINPNAGVKKKENYCAEIVSVFEEYNYETMIFFTRKSGDATELVKKHATDEFDLIVCMGGDGTLNETFSGAVAIGWDKPIGYIPAGSTNDFAASLGLPSDNVVDAAMVIMTGTPRKLDLGQFNGRIFVYTACCGIFSKVSYETPQKIKNWIGHLAYVMGGVKDITQFEPIYLEIDTKEEVLKDNFIFLGICNTFSIGGVMSLDESLVDLNDGEFELIAISKPKDLAQLNSIVLALSTQNYDNAYVKLCKISSADIRMPMIKQDWSLDGERGEGQEKISFKVIHDAVKLIC